MCEKWVSFLYTVSQLAAQGRVLTLSQSAEQRVDRGAVLVTDLPRRANPCKDSMLRKNIKLTVIRYGWVLPPDIWVEWRLNRRCKIHRLTVYYSWSEHLI